jgi:PPOX class probable F420-dependent enzyme
MDHVASLAVARIERFLELEPIVWLSTVRPDGTPHIVPIWFWWDGEALLVFSKPDAQKVRNLRARPSAMLALGEADEDFDIGLLEGRAEILDRSANEILPPEYVAKYADRMAAIGLTPAEYAATYSLVIRIIPDRYLGWHGRTLPLSARVAGAPAESIVEPRRDTIGDDGEPFMPRPTPRTPEPVNTRLAGRPSLRDWLADPLARGRRGLSAGLPRPRSAGAL